MGVSVILSCSPPVGDLLVEVGAKSHSCQDLVIIIIIWAGPCDARHLILGVVCVCSREIERERERESE